MPHKHTRRKGDKDATQWDLPPSSFARPLPVAKGSRNSNNTNPESKKRKRKNGASENKPDEYGPDDTPKAFARLMRFKNQKGGQSGLDDGKPPPKKKKQNSDSNGADTASKKRKRDEDQSAASTTTTGDAATTAPLQIMPHESLRDFSARVDRSMPVAGLARKGKDPGARMTKHEKRLRKLQAGWRADEARIREKEEEEREEAEEAEEELKEMYGEEVLLKEVGKKHRGKKEDDPWAVLKTKRETRTGLHDVAHEPPKFDRLPKEKLKVKGGAAVKVGNVPAIAGSLMRREQLSNERQAIIERYREMMKEKRKA